MTWPPTEPPATDVASFAEALVSLRALQDTLASVRLDGPAFAELATTLDDVRSRFEPLMTDEQHQAFGRVGQLPVRGHAMVPEFKRTHREAGRLEGTVTFGRWFMGGGMAAHGGAIALLFDEVIGIMAATEIGQLIRTAYLKVDYRALTPVDTELRAIASIESFEGRKILVRGELWHGDVLCAEADGLFLTLLPGQR